MKNFVKNILCKNVKKAYTAYDYYTPKKPKCLK